MKRRLIAATWIIGATVPLLMATVFLVGCCALPFHHIVHKLMPVCQMAANMMRGDHRDAATPAPAREKQEPVKRVVTNLSAAHRIGAAAGAIRVLSPTPAASYRSFISLGAIRCDRDVGLHVLVETFLI